jgi:hypothetical protein
MLNLAVIELFLLIGIYLHSSSSRKAPLLPRMAQGSAAVPHVLLLLLLFRQS